MLRAFTYLILAATLAAWLHREQEAGRFRSWDEGYLGLLMANARERFDPALPAAADAAAAPRVVLAKVDEADRGDYAAWPPAAMDLHLMLKRLAQKPPASLTLALPLDWAVTEETSAVLAQLGDELLRFPAVVAAVPVSTAPGGMADGPVMARLPALGCVLDADKALPCAAAVGTAPSAALLARLEPGLHSVEAGSSAAPGQRVPVAYRVGAAGRVVPSAWLQVMALATGTPFAQMQLECGMAAGLGLSGGRYVVLSQDGRVRAPADAQAIKNLTTINAVDLMTPEIAEDGDSGLAQALAGAPHVVLGTADAVPLAQALARSLALPQAQRLGLSAELAVAALSLLLGLHVLQRRAGKALGRGLLLAFALFLVSYFGFSSTLCWLPLTVPLAVLGFATMLAMLWGPAGSSAAEPAGPAASSTLAAAASPEPSPTAAAATPAPAPPHEPKPKPESSPKKQRHR